MAKLVHIAGACMIDQATDELSHGDFTEGVVSGKPILSCVPLNQSVLSRRPGIFDWIKSWVPS
jgi:hypothetical protein